MPTITLCACCQLLCPSMLLLHASQLISDTSCGFMASTNFLVYPCETLSNSCTSIERNLVGWSNRPTHHSISSNPSIFIIFIQKFCNLSAKICGALSCCSHIRTCVATGLSSKEGGNSLSRNVTQLLKVPQKHLLLRRNHFPPLLHTVSDVLWRG